MFFSRCGRCFFFRSGRGERCYSKCDENKILQSHHARPNFPTRLLQFQIQGSLLIIQPLVVCGAVDNQAGRFALFVEQLLFAPKKKDRQTGVRGFYGTQIDNAATLATVSKTGEKKNTTEDILLKD